jgi:dihydropteroate synthase
VLRSIRRAPPRPGRWSRRPSTRWTPRSRRTAASGGPPCPAVIRSARESGCDLVSGAFAAPGRPARLVGIVNITEDSFSDGGRYLAAAIWAGTGRFFAGRLAALQAAGIARDRLIIDPGLGYFLGSNPEPSLAALARIGDLKARFGVPVLVSPSRKSFLRTLTGCSIAKAGPASLAAELFAISHGADYIRTHDVAALREALTVLTALARQERPDPTPPNAGAT